MRPEDGPEDRPEDGAGGHAESQRDGRSETLLGVLDDLEMQAGGLHLADRAVEVAELSAAQYAEVDLLARIHGSLGCVLRVATSDGQEVRGRLAAVGADWLMVDDGTATSYIHLRWVALVSGLGPGAVPADARPMSSRLSLRSVIRRLGEEGATCAVHLQGGRVVHGSPLRVGADFIELREQDAAGVLTLPIAMVTVVRRRLR